MGGIHAQGEEMLNNQLTKKEAALRSALKDGVPAPSNSMAEV